MKRNESILVYSVTGLLVVILAVAILFGNEQGAQAQMQSRARALDELAGVNAAPDTTAAPPADPARSPAADGPPPATAEVASATKPAPSGAAEPALAAGAADQPAAGADPLLAVPLVAPGQPPAPTAADPATQALMLLGDSVRDGNYRIVTVRHADTFSELVQRWCGGLDQLEVAESLNEELNLQRLDAGTKVCLPWVDDAQLVAAHLARKQRQEAEVKVVEEARNQGKPYKIKAGDKLWNIAVAAVGQKKAAQFIEQVKALNPELLADPGKLIVGKTIYLPR